MDVFVFEVKGAKGEGIVTAEFVTIDVDTEAVTSGEIKLPSGETYDLFPEKEVSAEKAEGE